RRPGSSPSPAASSPPTVAWRSVWSTWCSTGSAAVRPRVAPTRSRCPAAGRRRPTRRPSRGPRPNFPPSTPRAPSPCPGGARRGRLRERVAASPASGEVVAGLPGVMRAEIEHALDEEMALTLEDLLDRRTRSLSFDRRQGIDGVEAAAAISAQRLGWSAERAAAEIDGYRRLAASLRSFV